MVIETNITKMFGIKHPIISAPMGPFYTTELTAEVSEAGVSMRKARNNEAGIDTVCPVMGSKFKVKEGGDAADYKGKSY